MTPGGGVLKIKLSKKKPIKITAGAPDGEPDPAQTKLKTVHEPITKESGWLPLDVSSNVLIKTEQPREKELPPVRASQPTLGIDERRGPHILPKRVNRPNANGNGDPDRNGSSHGHGNSPHSNSGSNRDGNSPINGDPQRERYSQRGGGGSNVMGNPMGMGVPQIEEKDLPEEMGIQMGEIEVLTLMIVEMGMILHPHQTPHHPEEKGIGDPNMFMYCKGLQGHQARKGNLDNLDRQEGMAEMGKLCH